jgi:hypothetical protein
VCAAAKAAVAAEDDRLCDYKGLRLLREHHLLEILSEVQNTARHALSQLQFSSTFFFSHILLFFTQESKAQEAAAKHRQVEIERRMHPRTATDFEILYNELEAWRLQVSR